MQKPEGFEGQKMIVLPETIVRELQENPLTRHLYVTDIGYYPHASYHFRERAGGSPQNILIYCTEGRGWFEVEGKKQVVAQNQYFVVPAQAGHRYGADKDAPWSIYWMHFSGEVAACLMPYPNQVLEIDHAPNARFSDRILLFEEIYRNLGMGYSTDNLAYASICLWHLLGSFKYLAQFRKIKDTNLTDPVSRAIEYMRAKLPGKLSLDEIASHCGMSLSHFCFLFKKTSGRTPLDYLTHLRIQQACQLLDFTKLKVKEIAPKTGFDDPFYFSRVFAKIMGMSPDKYRRLKKG
jgi:AraC-like DNA-binding protein